MYKTKEESLNAYKQYVDDHIANVSKAYEMYGDIILTYFSDIYLPDVADILKDVIRTNILSHDASKYSDEEYYAYAAKFKPYSDNTDSTDIIKKNFDDAWKHHYMNNQHHPEFWSLGMYNSDDLYIPMSLEYVVEMVCDWIAVSMSLHTKITDWWAGNGGYKDKKNFECIDRVMDGINAFINDYGSKIDEECLKKG